MKVFFKKKKSYFIQNLKNFRQKINFQVPYLHFWEKSDLKEMKKKFNFWKLNSTKKWRITRQKKI